MQKKVTFEQEQLGGVDDIVIEVSYTYSYRPAKIYGDPASCYPEETESEITLPADWKGTVLAAYIDAAREAIKKIENDLVPELVFQNMPRQWAEEEGM